MKMEIGETKELWNEKSLNTVQALVLIIESNNII